MTYFERDQSSVSDNARLGIFFVAFWRDKPHNQLQCSSPPNSRLD